jgi:tryptophan synthase beta subunit
VDPGTLVVLNLSGRGDKDVETVTSLLDAPDTPPAPSDA